jgi:membrane fusion protein, heavy metal efflux system
MFTKRSYFLICFCLLLFAGCGERHDHDHRNGGSHQAHGDHGGGHATSVTQRSEQSELFMEYEPLVAGKEAAFLIHLTRLTNFSAVTEAEVTLLFKNEEGKVWKFRASQPLREGIFKLIAQIQTPGSYSFEMQVTGTQVTDTFNLGQVAVYAKAKDVEHVDEHEDENQISFLKEQQWQGNFDVKEAEIRELSPVIQAQGNVRAPLNATRAITASVVGLVQPTQTGLPLLGASIEAGQKLAEIEVAPGAEKTAVISPVSGVIAVVHVRSGDRVEQGWKLFEVIDLSSVWVEAEVYEPDVPKVRGVQEAVIQVPGSDQSIASNSVVSVGATIDQASRTLPVIFEVSNEKGFFKVGASVSVDIKTGTSEKKLAIPRSALVDVDGRWVVYVQVSGESFEQRSVVKGRQQGEWIEIEKGIKPGEHVVTKGAYTVRLASSSSDIPAHGHAH